MPGRWGAQPLHAAHPQAPLLQAHHARHLCSAQDQTEQAEAPAEDAIAVLQREVEAVLKRLAATPVVRFLLLPTMHRLMLPARHA